MQKNSPVLILALVTISCALSSAQDAEKSNDDTKKKEANLEMAVEMTTTIMSKMVEKAELSDDQQAKIDGILDENVKDLVVKRQELQTFLTAEEKETFNAALKLARKARYDNDKAEAYALKKLKLSDDRKKAYTDLSALVKKIDNTMMSKISAVLTDEQRAKVPLFNKNKNGKPVKVNGAEGSEPNGSSAKGGDAKEGGAENGKPKGKGSDKK